MEKRERRLLEQLTRKINYLMLLTQINYSTKADKGIRNNLTHSQVLFLQFIKMLNSPTMGKLSSVIGSSSSFASKLTTELENANLVERIHKKDFRREVFVELTKTGKRAVNEIEDFDTTRRIKLLEQISHGLGYSKIKILEEIVDYLIRSIKEAIDKNNTTVP